MYNWNCLALNNSEEQHIIPSTHRCPSVGEQSIGSTLYIIPFTNLSGHCLGSVFSINYCYQYIGTGDSVFNWTIIILDNSYSIINMFHTESDSSRLNCTNVGQSTQCCDVTHIKDFNLSHDVYAFGVTESTYGNTHSAVLLAFSSSIEDYLVPTSQLNSVGLINNLAVGYSFSNHQIPQPLGLRCLWFVIGEFTACMSPNFKFVSYMITVLAMSICIAGGTDQSGTIADQVTPGTTMQTSTSRHNTKVSETTVSVQDGPDLSIDISPLLTVVVIVGGTIVIAIIITIILLTVIGIKLFKARKKYQLAVGPDRWNVKP